MGGWRFEVTYRRTRGGKKPRALLNELFEKVVRRLGPPLTREKAAYALLRDSDAYVFGQRRGWEASEGCLTYQFDDNAGCSHATAAAFHHWVSRKITELAVREAPHLEQEYGIRIVVSPAGKRSIRKLLGDGQILYAWKSKLYLAQGGATGVRLVGDMTDVEGPKLPPRVRAEVQQLVESGTCPCPICADLREKA